MKIIIVEGIDNVGKSTLTKALADVYPNYSVMVIHSDAKTVFTELVKTLKELDYMDYKRSEGTKETIVVLDRSWKDEYVYGPLYRNKTLDEQRTYIWDIAGRLRKIPDLRDKTYEILMKASPEFAIKHDDNKSFTSQMNYETRVSKIKTEINLFDEMWTMNELFLNNDHRMIINMEDSGEFVPLEDVKKLVKNTFDL